MREKTHFKTDIVERYKNGESSYQISKSEGCSYNAVLRELKRRGIDTGLSFWTKSEVEKLRELYPITCDEELLKDLPNRKKKSIGGMAGRLGLKKRAHKRNCRDCGKMFIIIKHRHGREICLRCVQKQWEHNHPKNASKREKRWLQRNPEYMKNYVKTPRARERINRYSRQLRKENPQIRLNQNIGTAIYHSLRGKKSGRKSGRKWEDLVDYTLTDLTKHLEKQFDDRINWENYGSYWHLDHIKPKSLFKYLSSDAPEFRKCWALENLQPLERIANLRKSNIFIFTL